jgi:hypothetical protein
MTTTAGTFTAAWLAGGVDVALELIAQSDPAILSLIVDDLLGEYAGVSDTTVSAAAETAGTASGAALDTSSYAALVSDLITASNTVKSATGRPGDKVAVTDASWVAILGLVDGDGRRVFAGSPSNADGQALLTATSVNVGGITVFHSPQSLVDFAFNDKSLRVAEKAPMVVQADNPALMGRDVGVLGAVITLPIIPAGIVKFSA